MTDEGRQLCKNLRALSPGYSKMDGSYVEIGLEAANVIERLMGEVKNWELWAKSQSNYQGRPTVKVNVIANKHILVTVKTGETVQTAAFLSTDEARGLYANLGLAIDEVQNGT